MLGAHRESRAGACVCIAPGFVRCLGSPLLPSFTKVYSCRTEIFSWPQVCAEQSKVNSRCRLLPSAYIQYPRVLPTHHPNDLHPWAPTATLESKLPGTKLMARKQHAPFLFCTVPRRLLAFVPAVAGVIMWVCLIVAIVRGMRRPIVLLRGAPGPGRSEAGGDAAAGGSRRCSQICWGPRCLPGKPRQQFRGDACTGGRWLLLRASGSSGVKGCMADCVLI